MQHTTKLQSEIPQKFKATFVDCLKINELYGDLKAYTYGFFSSVSYYRDRYGLEADIVLHLDDGRYALIECKLGSNEIEEGANHLTRLHNLIVEHNRNEKQVPIAEPDLKIVLTGGQYGYTREDGVHVIPLPCLRP